MLFCMIAKFFRTFSRIPDFHISQFLHLWCYESFLTLFELSQLERIIICTAVKETKEWFSSNFGNIKMHSSFVCVVLKR